MNFLNISPGHSTPLSTPGGLPDAVHLFEKHQIRAVNAALAARRPLLLRGEPGIGKSQLARAVAQELEWAFVAHVVDARSESRDLQWRFDAIARLADAQVAGARAMRPATPGQHDRQAEHPGDSDPSELGEDSLNPINYIHPGPLWWAFDWGSAQKQADRVKLAAPSPAGDTRHKQGCVLLIDEIDKAEADLPNGLLEALGSGRFTPQGLGEPVQVGAIPPLVIITTNEERNLPDAFIRRCLVLHLGLPRDDDLLRRRLIERGRAHLEQAGYVADAKVLAEAADMLVRDRATAREQHWRPLPGQAEFLDLLWAVVEQSPKPERQRELVAEVACYLLRKHPDAGEQLLAEQEREAAESAG